MCNKNTIKNCLILLSNRELFTLSPHTKKLENSYLIFELVNYVYRHFIILAVNPVPIL